MRHIIDTLKRLVRCAAASRREMPPAAVVHVVREVERTQDVEYSCDEVHRLLDQFAELILRGQDDCPQAVLPCVVHQPRGSGRR